MTYPVPASSRGRGYTWQRSVSITEFSRVQRSTFKLQEEIAKIYIHIILVVFTAHRASPNKLKHLCDWPSKWEISWTIRPSRDEPPHQKVELPSPIFTSVEAVCATGCCGRVPSLFQTKHNRVARSWTDDLFASRSSACRLS